MSQPTADGATRMHPPAPSPAPTGQLIGRLVRDQVWLARAEVTVSR